MKDIIIIDIETTGFLANKGLIVEIGIALINLEDGIVEPLYNKIVKEDGFGEEHKDSWIFNNSDLKFEDVNNAEPINKEEIQKILNEYWATAYNKKFDFDFLESRGFRIKQLPCPMLVSTPIMKLKKEWGYKYPSVQEAYDYFIGKEYIEKHRGLDDAMHEAEIVIELFKRNKFVTELKKKSILR